jgi:ABC-2 type transport system permease protein
MEICWAGNLLPPSYIFEGMRAVVLQGEVRLDYLLTAGALNLIWIGFGVVIFLAFFRTARERGTLPC